MEIQKEENDMSVGSRIMGALFEYCKAEHITPDNYASFYDTWHQSFEEEGQPKDDEDDEDGILPNYVYHIWKDGDYIVIVLGFLSMMFNDDMIEEFLCEKWRQIREAFLGIADVSYGYDVSFLCEKGLGIRLEACAAIGGYSEGGDYPRATLFTPDDIKRLLLKWSFS